MRFVKSTAGSGVERKRKRKKVHRHSSGSEGGADSGSDAEWNDEDNNAYLDFLKDFFFSPDKSKTHEVNDDEEADPEYSIKDDEEEHDKEELRADPAVKISKKELMELLAELGNEECDFPCVPTKPSDEVIAVPEASDVKDVSVMVTATDIGIHQPGCVAQEENNEYLMPEITRDKIKYQLQQHIQLLAQTYALTVISPIEEDRMLARESKKMIIELNSYAINYGPLTSFRVKNIHHAANLVNTWPAPVVSKSPIKKKILEERYRSQQRLIYGGNGLLFCREVVKKIAESPVFMYPLLLPTYPNLHSDYKVTFTSNEDALIAIGHHAMQEKMYEGLKTRQKAKLIGELLLPGRPAKQIFHRIKNARKVDKNVKNENLGIKILRKYLLEGVKPPSPLDSWSQDLMQAEPIPPIDQPKLPPTWLSLLTKLRLEIFDETVTNLPVKRSRKKNMKVSEVELKPKATRSSSSKSKVRLNENKLCGSGVTIPDIPVQYEEETSEETERIPVYGPSGTAPAAFIVIAKKFLPKTSTEKKDSNNNNSDSSSDLCKAEVLSATPIGEPFSLPKSFSPESERGLGSVIDLQTIDSPLKREIFQMATINSEDNKKKAPLQPPRPRRKTADQEATSKKRKHATKSVESQSASVAKKPKEETSLSDCSLHTSRGPREDHAARTWVYERKSAAEIAATIERKMKGKKKSRSKKAGTGSAPAPDMNVKVKVSESSDDDETALPGAAVKSRSGVVGMSVPSLDIEVEPAVSQETQSGTLTDGRGVLPRKDSQARPNQAAPTNSNEQQQRTDSSSNSQASDKSGAGKSTASSSRSSRGVKRERGGGKQTAGDGDGDEDPPERPRVPSSKAADDDIERRDEDSEEEGEEKDIPDTNTATKAAATKTTTNVSRKSTTESAPKNPKKFKRSPQTKKRIPKYKTEQIQKLLDEADSEVNVEEIENAFAEEFWAKCQHTLDPVLYNNLVQVFCDFGEKNTSEDEVFTKVEEMLKDHPDLLIDLATMIEPQLLQKNNLLKDNYVIQAYIRFMHLLEKLTLQCPQLRARVLQKLRGLRDLEKVTEQDVQELVDLYFQGNPIMTDALKAMFPAIFPPQSAVHPEDFEEINFDDENLNQSEEGMAIETVVLPEETNVPATSTCPCDCHSNAQNMTFHTKVRHCQKCCIKDGKVFLHSGRFMKQVNIEFTTREKAEEILSGVACGHCFESLKTTPKSVSPKKLPKKRGSRARVNISECDSESEVKQSTSGLKLKVAEVPKTDLQPPTDTRDAAAAAVKPKIESEDLEEGEIADEDDPPNNEPREATSRLPVLETTLKPVTPLSSLALNSRPATIITGPSEQSSNIKEWNFNDDEILLQTCQQEGPLPSTFEKLVRSKILPGRTVEEVQERFHELVKMIKIVHDQEKKACR